MAGEGRMWLRGLVEKGTPLLLKGEHYTTNTALDVLSRESKQYT